MYILCCTLPSARLGDIVIQPLTARIREPLPLYSLRRVGVQSPFVLQKGRGPRTSRSYDFTDSGDFDVGGHPLRLSLGARRSL